MKKRIYLVYNLLLFALFFPAILAHELMHYMTALFLGLNPSFIKIKGNEKGFLELSVEFDDKRDWRSFIVYLSPLFSSFLLIYFMFYVNDIYLFLYLLASLFFTLPSEHDVKEALKIILRW